MPSLGHHGYSNLWKLICQFNCLFSHTQKQTSTCSLCRENPPVTGGPPQCFSMTNGHKGLLHISPKLILNSIKISSGHILFLSLSIISKFCTEHGSYTAMLCAKFQNDWTTNWSGYWWKYNVWHFQWQHVDIWCNMLEFIWNMCILHRWFNTRVQ